MVYPRWRRSCFCFAVRRIDCTCDHDGWTIVIRPQGTRIDGVKAQWIGFTQDRAEHLKRLKVTHRLPGYKIHGLKVNYRAWSIHNGWVNAGGRIRKTE